MFLKIVFVLLLNYSIADSSLTDVQNKFTNLLLKVEKYEKRYGEYVSAGLLFSDKTVYSLEWYKKFNGQVYWNYDYNCLYTTVKKRTFPISDYICHRKKVCQIGPYTLNLKAKSVKKLYIKILKKFINIFNQRLKVITN